MSYDTWKCMAPEDTTEYRRAAQVVAEREAELQAELDNLSLLLPFDDSSAEITDLDKPEITWQPIIVARGKDLAKALAKRLIETLIYLVGESPLTIYEIRMYYPVGAKQVEQRKYRVTLEIERA